MKSRLNSMQFQWVLLYFLFATSLALTAQSMPQINARFTNPRFEAESRKYFLDVELSSKHSKEVLFGMNLRFYFDASLMEFLSVDQFQQGYGILGEVPKPFLGNETSGVQLFNFDGAAAYVNGAIQLMDENASLEIVPGKWIKLFRVSFKLPLGIQDAERFCPSVIWDLKSNLSAGGFLPGGDGFLVTLKENNSRTREVSAPGIATGTPFNWQYNEEGGMPYGKRLSRECISVAELVSTEELDKVDKAGYGLFQNQPNPFEGRTVIEFVLPVAQEATLTFYDVEGVILEEIKGDYEAGRNQIILKHKSWMAQSSIVYYRLQTEKYISKTRKMNVIRA